MNNIKVPLNDIACRGELVFERDWNSSVKDSQFIKITIDDKEIITTKDSLFTILTIMGDEQHLDLIADKFTKHLPVRNEYHTIGVTATKDIKQGEEIKIPLSFSVNMQTGNILIAKGRNL